MGEVYRARHLHLDEIRIIKVTKPDAAGEGSEPRRFQDEARLATLVRHPNVAALYDFSRLPDGSFYMVWEFIDGITLEEWLRRHGPLPAARALEVARQVLAGLGRDPRAGNRPPRPLPRQHPAPRGRRTAASRPRSSTSASPSASPPIRSSMTGTGLFLGKLKYCSPEQAGALPRGETLDARSDLYSFGVVLYEMLAGKPPFEAQTPEAYLGQHLHAAPPPLDTRRLPAAVGPRARGDHQARAREEPRPSFSKRRGIPSGARGARAGGADDRRDGRRSAAPRAPALPVRGGRRPHPARRRARHLRRDPRDEAIAGRGGRGGAHRTSTRGSGSDTDASPLRRRPRKRPPARSRRCRRLPSAPAPRAAAWPTRRRPGASRPRAPTPAARPTPEPSDPAGGGRRGDRRAAREDGRARRDPLSRVPRRLARPPAGAPVLRGARAGSRRESLREGVSGRRPDRRRSPETSVGISRGRPSGSSTSAAGGRRCAFTRPTRSSSSLRRTRRSIGVSPICPFPQRPAGREPGQPELKSGRASASPRAAARRSRSDPSSLPARRVR